MYNINTFLLYKGNNYKDAIQYLQCCRNFIQEVMTIYQHFYRFQNMNIYRVSHLKRGGLSRSCYWIYDFLFLGNDVDDFGRSSKIIFNLRVASGLQQ